ncbi:MAG: hypothetical protein ACXWTS_04100 [Methylococcaceae bacterium]
MKFLIELNFYLSVIVLIVGSLLSVSGNNFIFEFNEDLYGALDNNLRMMMIYLAVTEAVIVGYCLLSQNFKTMILVGFFLILMIGSLEFYGEVNTVAIDPNFPLFFLYTGVSHLLFGVNAAIEKNSAIEQPENLSNKR